MFEGNSISFHVRILKNTFTIGTDSSAPQVAGIVALMLEVNPDLTWRYNFGFQNNLILLILKKFAEDKKKRGIKIPIFGIP